MRRQSRRSEGGYFALEPQRRAVAAWIGAAHERAVTPDDPVGVADPREELGRRLHAVAPPFQRGHDAARHARLPVEALLSKAYAARRRAQFDPEKAQSFAFGDPEGDTTGFVVADPAGNVISVIQSLFNAFGSGVVVAGTGVVLQNRGRHFSLDPAHPAALAPRKRPFHTLIASIVTRDDEPLLALATMGGNGQAMFHAQVVTNVLDYGIDRKSVV